MANNPNAQNFILDLMILLAGEILPFHSNNCQRKNKCLSKYLSTLVVNYCDSLCLQNMFTVLNRHIE